MLTKNELKYAVGWAAAVMLLTCVPLAVVWWYVPRDGVFPLVLFNSDDHGVYFGWMRQARDGHLLFRNLFTTEPQRGVYFHLYFLLLGWLARVPGIDIPLAYHLGRVVFGALTLVLVYRLSAFFTADVFARRCVFWTTALSAGLGWLFWGDVIAPLAQPVDVWQPEALTFLSLYTNGLFCVSLALMLGVVICLLLAEERGWKWAVAAGLAGLLLGNIHSYDMIHLTVAWGAYLLARWITGRRFPARELGLALLAAVVAAPSVAHLAWLYKTEPVFQARADTPTLSPRLALYLLGYGLLIPLALWGAAVLRRLPETDLGARPEAVRLRRLLPAAWLVAGFVAAYAPFAFQRKMIMGTHLPLALLAGLAVADLARRAAASTHRPRAAGVAAALLVGLLSITSARFLCRDAAVALREGRTSTTVHPVFWPASDLKALEWLGAHALPEAALLRDPFQGVLVPAYSGRAVYAGHWGETPRFSDRVKDVFAFYGRRWTSDERLRFLRENRITHVLEASAERALGEVGQRFDNSPPLAREPFLRPVFQEGSTTLYEVVEPVAAPG